MKTLRKACFATLALCAAATSAPAETNVYCCSAVHCCAATPVPSTECSAAGGVGYSTRAVCLRSCDQEICL